MSAIFPFDASSMERLFLRRSLGLAFHSKVFIQRPHNRKVIFHQLIGENSVIGAGSVVTKDISANVIAFGSPCKVYREIDEHDEEYYFKDRRFDNQPEK